MSNEKEYKTFWSFYPYYLTEHARPANRWLHFVGTSLVIICFALGFWWGNLLLWLAMPFCGYGFAWFGHFDLEKNRPATFKYPLYSLGSDFVMFFHILTGQIDKKVEEAHRLLGVENKWK
jgi:hypothetical protein